MKNNALGLYLHIPFCLQKCRYCDFYSLPGKDGAETERYVRALCRQIEAAAALGEGRRVDTVYFGGGTPTLLTAAQFREIFAALRASFALEKDAEITSECNPYTGNGKLFAAMREAGVNRLSVGLQSANEEELKALGRLHTAADFSETFRAARAAGFDNLNADIMLGIPHQTARSLEKTLFFLGEHAPEHVSAYELRVEEGTPFFRVKDTLPLPGEDEAAELYLTASAFLRDAGYEHYEISNFAKPGFASRHNLRYWEYGEYLGFGAAAHSFYGGVRYAAPRDVNAFVQAEKRDFFALFPSPEPVSGKEAQDEWVMLAMRLSRGVDKAAFAARFGTSFEEAYGRQNALEKAGFLVEDDAHVAFTEKGMLVSNAILSDWLDFGKDQTEEHL